MSRETVLRAVNVSKAFGGQSVFSGLSLALQRGETLALTGPSGIGKTTLFNLLAGLLEPDAGQVFLGEREITGQAGAISYMQQKDLLLPYYTVLYNTALPLLIKGVPEEAALAEAGAQFACFGLEGCQQLYPRELSGGMRQRAALLRTYMQSQEVVLLDEPFGALDAVTRRRMQQWYQGIARQIGLSTIFITHDPDEALILADRVLVLNGSPATIVGELVLDCAKPEQGFELEEQFLAYKRRLLALLG